MLLRGCTQGAPSWCRHGCTLGQHAAGSEGVQ
jgi:hypothetical protein